MRHSSSDLGRLNGDFTDNNMPNLASCHIREVNQDDYPILEKIYSAQASETLPDGYFEEFREAIRCSFVLYLVAEFEGRIVGGGGIQYLQSKSSACLTFGIVAREYQRRGLGTSILLTRLSLLEPDDAGCEVTLTATKWSAPFFRRIGFGMPYESVDELGQTLLHGYLRMFPAHVEQMKRIVREAGVRIVVSREIPCASNAESQS